METSRIHWVQLNENGLFINQLEAIPVVAGRFVTPTVEMIPSWKAWVAETLTGKARMQQEREILAGVAGKDDGYCLEKLTAWSETQAGYRLDKWQGFAPARYADCTLDNYKIATDDSEQAKRQEAVLGRVRRFAEKLPEHIQNGVNIVFYGPPGTGKTHLMAALLRDAMVNMALKIEWKTGAEIARQADPRQKDYGDGIPKTRYASRYNPLEYDSVRRFSSAEILAIDDLALPGQPLAFYSLQAATAMVDEAYQLRKPVWLTINATNQTQIVELISGPVADRLKDGAFTAYFDWSSYRRKGDF